VKEKGRKDVIDVGSGTGIISLIMAQRFPNASIVAMDISARANMLSLKNVKNSPFRDRIVTVREDFFNLNDHGRFDVVISNPPYYENGILPNEEHKLQSRHGVHFPLEAFFLKAYAITKPDGLVAAVFPYTRWNHVRIEAASTGWYVEKLAFLNAKTNETRRRVLVQWSKKPIKMPPTPLLLEWGQALSDESKDSSKDTLYDTLQGLYVNL
jgi:tRNA1Val (adenine37-N6)-methyltransferase